MKKLFSSVLVTLLAAGLIGSGGLVSASGSVPSSDEYSISHDLTYYETAFNNYSAPAIAQETLCYLNNTKPVWANAEQVTYAIAMKTTKTDTKSSDLIQFINSHQKKVQYVRATFTTQAEFEECIRQSLKNFDAPVIIRESEAGDGTMGQYMAITRQYVNYGELTYYLNDPNWKHNAGWTTHSKVNPEQGWEIGSQQVFESIMRTSGHDLYICQPVA